MTGTFQRAGDRWKKPATIGGFALLALVTAIELLLPAANRPSDAIVHVMLVIGAGLISPGFILDLLRAWRGGNTPPPPAGGGAG
jgi:hypothetical protein